MKIGDRKNELLAFLNPLPGILTMAFRTVAVSAGVIGVVHKSASVALEDIL